MKKHAGKIALLALAATLAGLAVYGFWPKPVGVEIVRAIEGPLVVTVSEDGQTRVRERYVVSTPVAGKLLRLDLDPGDPIMRDDTVIARIEPVDPTLLDARAHAKAQARVQAAEAARFQADAALRSAQEAQELARHAFERAQGLLAEDTISQSEFDESEHRERMAAAEVRSAEFAVRVADFELEMARAALIRTSAPRDDGSSWTLTIRAPIDGQVLRVFRRDTGVLTAGTELLELGDLRDLEMVIDVLSTDAVAIRPGARVVVEHWGGSAPLEGVVRLVEPAAFLKVSALGVEEQRVNVIADFTTAFEERRTLGDGYRVEASIVVHAVQRVVYVSSGALFIEEDDWYVYRVVGGRAERQRVEVGVSNGEQTEILEGISAGDAVILHPTDTIRHGVPIRPL